MSGCLVGLIIGVITAIFGLIRMTVMLMATSVGSLVVGPDEAVERITDSWIEQSNARGVNLGYNPVTRGGLKAAAVVMLIIGWIVTIGVIILIVSLMAQ